MQNRAVTSLESIILVVGCGLSIVGYWLDCTILPTTDNQQPITNIQYRARGEKRRFEYHSIAELRITKH